MSTQSIPILSKIEATLSQVKKFEKSEKLLPALSLLEDLSRKTRKKTSEISLKISYKIISFSLKLYKLHKKVDFLHRGECASKVYLSLFPKSDSKLPEKVLKAILSTLNSLAGVHRKSKQVTLALNNFSLCLNFKINLEKSSQSLTLYLLKLHLNISSFMNEIGNFKESLKYSKESLKIIQLAAKKASKQDPSQDQSELTSSSILSFICIIISHQMLGNTLPMQEAFEKASKIVSTSTKKDLKILEVLESLQGVENSVLWKAGTFDMESEKKPGLKTFHLELDQPVSWVRFQSEGKVLRATSSETRLPGRYYTKSQLKVRAKVIDGQDKLNFVSADDFFFHGITKNIQIGSDVKHLQSPGMNDRKTTAALENKEKRKISDLRLKKKFRLGSNLSPVPDLFDKLKSMIESQEELFKQQHRRLKNVLNSSQSKFLLQKICGRGTRRVFPEKSKKKIGLLFKPLGPSKNPSQDELKRLNTMRRLSIFQHTKDEIETFMETVNEDLQKMTNEKKILSPSWSEGHLSKSTTKSSKTPEKTVKILRSSIGSTLKPKKPTSFYSIPRLSFHLSKEDSQLW
jgi:hypothetical protein